MSQEAALHHAATASCVSGVLMYRAHMVSFAEVITQGEGDGASRAGP